MRKVSGKFQESLRTASGKCQEGCRKGSGKSEDGLRNVSGKSQESLGQVSGKSRGSFKKIAFFFGNMKEDYTSDALSNNPMAQCSSLPIQWFAAVPGCL